MSHYLRALVRVLLCYGALEIVSVIIIIIPVIEKTSQFTAGLGHLVLTVCLTVFLQFRLKTAKQLHVFIIHTHTHNHFTALFPGLSRSAGARSETSGLYGARED